MKKLGYLLLGFSVLLVTTVTACASMSRSVYNEPGIIIAATPAFPQDVSSPTWAEQVGKVVTTNLSSKIVEVEIRFYPFGPSQRGLVIDRYFLHSHGADVYFGTDGDYSATIIEVNGSVTPFVKNFRLKKGEKIEITYSQ